MDKQLGFFTDVSLKKIEISGWPPQTLSSVSFGHTAPAPRSGQSRRSRGWPSTWRVAFDLRRGAHGRRVQDGWVRGIRPEAYKLAIRLVGAKPRRAMSPAQRDALAKARLASSLIPARTVQDGSALSS